jgi:hypothetical protein
MAFVIQVTDQNKETNGLVSKNIGGSYFSTMQSS